MKFYDSPRPLYLETNTSGIGLVARLLQVRDGMNWEHDEIPHNAIFWPIAFASKSSVSVEWCYTITECKAPGILHRLEKIPTTALQKFESLLILSH